MLLLAMPQLLLRLMLKLMLMVWLLDYLMIVEIMMPLQMPFLQQVVAVQQGLLIKAIPGI